MRLEGTVPLPNKQGLFKSFKSVKLFSSLISLITICVCFLRLGAFNQTLAATYYVDNTITDTYPANGTPDCTNYNTSTFACSGGSNSAYATIADVNAGSFSGDDQILFRKGQTWRDQLIVPSSGTSGHPITFGAFGSGAKPIINGSDIVTGWTNYSGNVWQATLMTEPTQVWFDGTLGTKETAIVNLDAQYEWYWTGNVLHVYSTSDPTGNVMEAAVRSSGIIVFDSYITIDGLDITKHSYLHLGSAVAVGSGSDGFILQNSDIHHNGSTGVNIAAGDPGDPIGSPWIKYNNIFSNGLASVDMGSGTGINIYSTDNTHKTTNGIIEHNYIYDNGKMDYGDHCVYEMAHNTIIRYNYISNCLGVGIKVNGHGVGSGAQIYYNLIVDNHTGGIRVEDDTTAPVNVKVYNNTIVNNNVLPPYAQFNYQYESGTPTGNEFKNNILVENNNVTAVGIYYGFDDRVAATIENAALGLDTNNNLFYFTAAGSIVAVRHTFKDYTTLAQYKAEMTSSDQNSIEENPYFVAGGDAKPYPFFYPRSYSPVINAGTDVGLTSDYLGVFVPQGAAPDIGAFEYTVSIPENIWYLFPLFMALPRLIFLLSSREDRKYFLALLRQRRYQAVLRELYLPYLNLVSSLIRRRV